jgi:hypothetical protein
MPTSARFNAGASFTPSPDLLGEGRYYCDHVKPTGTIYKEEGDNKCMYVHPNLSCRFYTPILGDTPQLDTYARDTLAQSHPRQGDRKVHGRGQ